MAAAACMPLVLQLNWLQSGLLFPAFKRPDAFGAVQMWVFCWLRIGHRLSGLSDGRGGPEEVEHALHGEMVVTVVLNDCYICTG